MSTARAIPVATATLPSTGSLAMPAAIASGAVLGVVYTLSPTTVWFLAASVALVWLGGRHLPPRERRWVCGLLIVALALRAAIVAALFLFGTADHMWFNTFFGDEQYLLVRSLRLRHFWLGTPLSLEAFFDVFELYGGSSYLNVIAYLQLLVGVAPYGVHLLNAACYVGGAIVLHRLCRAAFGRVPALITLAGVLFFPTLVIWSASGLKESMNFLLVTCVIACAVAAVQAPWRWRWLAAVAWVAGVLALRTLRAGAAEAMVVGVIAGFAARLLTGRVWRLVAAAAIVCLIAVPVARSGRVHDVALRVLQPAARVHLGHVLTRGHSYKLVDQRFYEARATDSMSWDEAMRFVGRAIVSIVLYPLPWDLQSWAELAYLPEQLLWYLILITAAIGVVAGVRRGALVTTVFAAYAVAALMLVALNTGNVGTLVRHRSFALPFLIALSAVGVTAIVGRLSGSPASVRR